MQGKKELKFLKAVMLQMVLPVEMLMHHHFLKFITYVTIMESMYWTLDALCHM